MEKTDCNNHLAINPLKNLEKFTVVLASASPRRRELLAMLDIPFEIRPLEDCDETYPADLPPLEISEFLAIKKSNEFYRRFQAESTANILSITADTMVIVDGKPIGKPTDYGQAKAMLRTLAGKTHTVVTGVSIRTKNKHLSFSSLSKVEFAELTEEEIEYYLFKYRPYDKAGAYGIQEWIGAVAIKSIQGSFYNVMGLPVHRLFNHLKTF